MKLETLIVQYLYKNKHVRLQDIGSFTISPDIFIPAETDKEVVLPPDSIHFEYDPKAQPDEGLINYIIEYTRKIRPLATSDLESFSILNRQFLNIGKPLLLEGIGAIHKNQQGRYEFSQGNTFNVKPEQKPITIKDKKEEEVKFDDHTERSENKTWLWVLLTLLLLGLGAWAVYYFMNKPATVEENNAAAADTTVSTIPTAEPAADTTTRVVISNNNTVNIALKDFATMAAANSYKTRLETYGHKLDIRTNADSSSFVVFMPLQQPIADSSRLRDSLKRFFGGSPYLLY